jgi:hypothetical protein
VGAKERCACPLSRITSRVRQGQQSRAQAKRRKVGTNFDKVGDVLGVALSGGVFGLEFGLQSLYNPIHLLIFSRNEGEFGDLLK